MAMIAIGRDEHLERARWARRTIRQEIVLQEIMKHDVVERMARRVREDSSGLLNFEIRLSWRATRAIHSDYQDWREQRRYRKVGSTRGMAEVYILDGLRRRLGGSVCVFVDDGAAFRRFRRFRRVRVVVTP